MNLQNKGHFAPCICDRSNCFLSPNHFFFSFSNRINNFLMHVPHPNDYTFDTNSNGCRGCTHISNQPSYPSPFSQWVFSSHVYEQACLPGTGGSLASVMFLTHASCCLDFQAEKTCIIPESFRGRLLVKGAGAMFSGCWHDPNLWVTLKEAILSVSGV